ncbi:MAG: GHKL domain-containing protein [Deltaproteobacteria bacterium]|nr:GHKL domain-containing protein [Deltaproteobacteria bacterium]
MSLSRNLKKINYIMARLTLAGVGPDCTYAQERQIILTNFISLAFSFTMFCLGIFFYFFDDVFIFIYAIFFMICLLGGIFFNYLGKIQLSQWCMILVPNLFGLIMCLCVGQNTSLAMGYFCLIGVPVLIADRKQIFMQITGMILPVFCYFLTFFSEFDLRFLSGIYGISAFPEEEIRIFIHPVYMIVISAELFYFSSISLKIEKRLVRNIERRKKAEEEMKASQEALVQSSRMAILGEMAGGIAHELNTPIGSLKLRFSQMLRLLNMTPVPVDKLRSILNESNETNEIMVKIVDGVRLVSRSGESDSMNMEGVKGMIEDALKVCSEGLKHHNIRLDIEDIPENLMIRCRRVQITQIILNLIVNAKHALRNVPEAKICIKKRLKANFLDLMIEDNGPGIPDEILDKIMNPFFTTKDIGEGSGLGLSISERIAKEHNGSLKLESRSDPTRFVLSLPFSVMHEQSSQL